jgi:hypothetical protein
MKRDLELIRKMVMAIEDASSGWAPQPLRIEGYSNAQVGYHAYLLVDGGMANGADATCGDSDGPEWVITSLTWAGHEFAEAARDETRWKKAMGLVQDKVGSVTIAVLAQLLAGLMKSGLGIP